MKCGRLPDFGFEEPELAVVRGLKPVNRDSEHSRDKAVLVFVPDRNQVTVRGRIDELQDIRTSRQNSAFHFDRRERQVDSLPDLASSHSRSDPRGPDLDAMLVQLPENQRKVIVMLKVLGVTLQGVARGSVAWTRIR
jgi:hypothetical protein